LSWRSSQSEDGHMPNVCYLGLTPYNPRCSDARTDPRDFDAMIAHSTRN
jgi:hypothetical protein